MTDLPNGKKCPKLPENESFLPERVKRWKAMDDLIAQDADLLEKTSPLSNERDAGQPWLRTYDAHL